MNTRFQANQRNFGPWNPFPAGTCPLGGVLTSDFLGYHVPQRMHNDAVNVLLDCDFEIGDTVSGRLCHSAACIKRTSMTLSRLRTIETCPAIYKPEENPAIFISKMLSDEVDGRISDYNATLGSPFAFGRSASNRAAYFGYKRRRTEAAPGVCVLVNNAVPDPRNHLRDRESLYHAILRKRRRLTEITSILLSHFIRMKKIYLKS